MNVPEKIYAQTWMSHFSEYGSFKRVISVSRESKFERPPSAYHDGTYEVIELTIPLRLSLLQKKFGRRLVFGVCENEYDVGCWVDGQPYGVDDEDEWSWTDEEYEYLYCCGVMAHEMRTV